MRAERLNVTALFHGHGKADRRLTVEAKQRGGRVGITAFDGCQIAEAKEPIAEAQVDGLKVFFTAELTAGPHGDALGTGFHDTCGRHRILRLQALQHLTLINAQRRELANGEIQVNDFALRAEQFDLAQVGHAANVGAYLLDVVAQLAERQAVGGERIDAAEHVTKLVVERRALNTAGQFAAHIADFLAHLVPRRRDIGTAGLALEKHENRRFTGQRVAFHVVQRVDFLELLFQSVGDLLQGVGQRRARPAGLNDHGLDGERRVFLAAQVQKRPTAHQQ